MQVLHRRLEAADGRDAEEGEEVVELTHHGPHVLVGDEVCLTRPGYPLLDQVVGCDMRLIALDVAAVEVGSLDRSLA